MSKTIPIAAALACGVALGFALGRVLPTPIAREIGKPDPADVTARATEILSGAEPLQRISEFSALLHTLGPDAVPAVREAIDKAPLEGGDMELVVFATWWAAFDPKAAVAWTVKDWRAGYSQVIGGVFRAWAHSNPKQALEATTSVRFPGQRDIAKDAVYAGWDESGQPGLWEASEHLPIGDQQRLAQVIARRRVVAIGFDKAIEWAQSFANPEVRDMVILRVASAAATSKENAPHVAAWATPTIVAAERPTQLPRRIGTRWVRHDPIATMKWLESLPPGIDRDDGVAESFRDWLMTDFPGAEAWIWEKIRAEKIDPWCEQAVAIFLKTNGLARPEESLATAARLEDQELREATTVVLVLHWTRKDPAAAEAWLAKSDLSADVRERARVAVANFATPAAQQSGLPHGPLGPPERPLFLPQQN